MKDKDKIWINLMELGHKIGCHQMPERSFFYKNYQYPVCARCTGVILGEIITIILILFGIRINLCVSVVLCLVMGFDWFIQYVNILESNNIRRLITGISGGVGLMYIYYYILYSIVMCVINIVKK